MNETADEVTSIGQVHVSVADLDRAVTFYRDVLGLRFLFDVPGQSMAFFEVGGVRLYLATTAGTDFESAPILYFTVDDIDAGFARLMDAGVSTIAEPAVAHRDDTAELWLAFFETPDGHTNALMEERPLSP